MGKNPQALKNYLFSLKDKIKNNKFFLSLLIIVIFTPWFWSFPIPKNLFNLNLKNDLVRARNLVEWERGKINHSSFDVLFSNWPTKLIQQRLEIVLENLDFGNYFFAGHPRERVDLPEKQKFFFFEFLLLMIGLINKDLKKYLKFLIFYSLSGLLMVFVFEWRTFEQTVFLSPPLIVIMALGLEKVFSWSKKWKVLFFSFAILEIIAFLNFYLRGFIK